MTTPPAQTRDERPQLALPGTPTQIANPIRTSIRTFIQNLVPTLVVLVPLVNLTLVSLSGFLQQQTDLAVPGWVFVWVNGGIAVTSFLAALTARIMAVPGVAAFIARRLPWLAPIRPSGT